MADKPLNISNAAKNAGIGIGIIVILIVIGTIFNALFDSSETIVPVENEDLINFAGREGNRETETFANSDLQPHQEPSPNPNPMSPGFDNIRTEARKARSKECRDVWRQQLVSNQYEMLLARQKRWQDWAVRSAEEKREMGVTITPEQVLFDELKLTSEKLRQHPDTTLMMNDLTASTDSQTAQEWYRLSLRATEISLALAHYGTTLPQSEIPVSGFTLQLQECLAASERAIQATLKVAQQQAAGFERSGSDPIPAEVENVVQELEVQEAAIEDIPEVIPAPLVEVNE